MYENHFPAEVFSSFDRLQNFARELNSRLTFPEFVMLGSKGVGKTSVVEGLVGAPLMGAGMTNRPVHLTFVNNPARETPRIVIKRDPLLKEFNYDQEVDLKSLPRQLAKRNKEESDLAVVIVYEYRYTLNFTIIDTPGVIVGDAESEALVKVALAPSHRHILCCIDAADAAEHTADMVKLLQSIDPELSRTTFVYTKLHSQIRAHNSTVEINSYLHSTSVLEKPAFLVTPVAEALASKASEPADYRKVVWQLQTRDLHLLEALSFDRTYAGRIGIHALRKFLVDSTWKAFQADVPVILRTLRSRRTLLTGKIADLRARIEDLTPARLRALANSYVVEFLQVIDQLITGSSEGNPNVNGQTLDEEKQALGLGEWKSADNSPITTFPDSIPYHDARIYGGQQFKRLLSSFGQVVSGTQMSESSVEVMATAAGINRLNNVPNYAWAACEIAAQEARKNLVPLLKQLSKRAQFVIERLPSIAKQIMDNRRTTKWNASPVLLATDVEQYPYFSFAVLDLFHSFVTDTIAECERKCMDEFLDTRTVYWHLAEDKQGKLPVERFGSQNAQESVKELAQHVFATLRDRVASNVQLKFFNFLLVPLQTSLVAGVQERTNVLSDDELEVKFEVSATKTKLLEEERLLTTSVDSLKEMEGALLENASRFITSI